jgi:S-adenosylmethionine:tRNA ribosyltransferase-isomerase
MIDLEQYNYTLPEELIRKTPLKKRDDAKLFVYNTHTDTIIHSKFSQLAEYLPEHSTLVTNVTRVLPVRLNLTKETGGKIEVFLLMNEYTGTGVFPGLTDRKLLIGAKVYFDADTFLEVIDQQEARFFFKPSFDPENMEEMLLQFGTTPVPHYLDGGDLGESELRERYQTVFAKKGMSVAAPTASLHFTEEVFSALERKHISRCEVLLNVGMGTFAPLTIEQIEQKKLHSEYAEISRDIAENIIRSKQNSESVIAVGTTALRTLETWGATEMPNIGFKGETDIFIYPPYSFKVADILITNFHLPKTSLMLLVDAFLKNKGAKRNVTELYREAIKEGYAFYSFGDSMLIL